MGSLVTTHCSWPWSRPPTTWSSTSAWSQRVRTSRCARPRLRSSTPCALQPVVDAPMNAANHADLPPTACARTAALRDSAEAGPLRWYSSVSWLALPVPRVTGNELVRW